MNTIRIYLAESGRIADLKKDFPLYQGQYQNKLLNVYVPTSILAPTFYVQESGTTVSEYISSTAVKIGMRTTERNGKIYVSKTSYMRYLKTLTYQGVEYAMYERKLPQEFTTFAGQGQNAPELVINVVNINNDTTPATIINITSSQTCSLDVMPSTYLDNDDVIEPSELDNINAQLSEINEILPQKQDKVDYALETSNKSVVGGINENKGVIDLNTSNINQNTNDISILRNRLDQIAETQLLQETYIGQMQGVELPTPEELTEFVNNTVNRQPQNGDTIIFVLEEQGVSTKTYKYTFASAGWGGYEITSINLASNDDFGLMIGTFSLNGMNNVLVDISGGEIVDIYVKTEENTYRNLKEYLSGTNTRIDNIVSGETSVGLALKSLADGSGNNIVDTYLTKELGASKSFVRNYAMPRVFNQVYFISQDGYSTQVPTTPESGIQFTTTTNNVGSFDLFQIQRINGAEFELSSSNGYENSIYISADRNCRVQFRLTTRYRKVGQEWQTLNVELTNFYNLTQDDIQKISFESPFVSLNGGVVTLEETDIIGQVLEVITQDSAETEFNVISNDIYPSSFKISSQSYVFEGAEGQIGKVIALGMDGIIESGNAVFTVQNAEDFMSYRTNQRRFLALMHLPIVGEISGDTPIKIEFGDTVYNLYSFMTGVSVPLTLNDLASVSAYSSEVGWYYYPEIIFIETSDIVGFAIQPATLTASQIYNLFSTTGSVMPMLSNGQIELHLSTSLANKIQRALLTPMDAPSQTELVAVGENGSQTMLNVGSGLGIVNGSIKIVQDFENVSIPTSSWENASEIDPFKFSATATIVKTIETNSVVELINDNAVLFANSGLSIGSISGQVVTFYAVQKPASDLVLKIKVEG